MESVSTSIPVSLSFVMKRPAYSGPVSSSPKKCRPKPLWIHCWRIPPSSLSRSMMTTLFSGAAAYASSAAARPAGPPPITAMSNDLFMAQTSFSFPASSFDSPPNFVSSVMGIFSSRASMSITRGEQKPPWQRPMPARVRRFTPSSERAPRRMASTISPSLMVSQRQMIRPYRESFAMRAARPALSSLRNSGMAWRMGL